MLLPIHIAAGGLAIVLGAVALSVKKGGTIHRRSGLLFMHGPASRRTAPGASSVAHVLRALHRGRLVLLDP